MKNLIAVVAGEPVSINSEIIAKTWKKTNKKNFFVLEIIFFLKNN